MDKPQKRSEGSPNTQAQRVLQRAHAEHLRKLRLANFNDRAKPNVEAKEEERSDAT
jgi:hypothetical protein